MISLPASVKIGFNTFAVTFVDHSSMDDSGGHVGMFNPRTSQISLSDGLSAPQSAETLLHEVLHGLFFDSALGLPPEMEEDIIAHLSPRLMAFLVDNPGFQEALIGQIQAPLRAPRKTKAP